MTQKYTKHTLFRVFVCWDAWIRHCVSNLVKEHSSFEYFKNQRYTLINLGVKNKRSVKSLTFYFKMATSAGFEPATCPLGGGCSIQLSHEAAGRPGGT